MNASATKSVAAKRWIVFGEALVDKFPEAVVKGGAPYNVARHLTGFTVPALFVSRVGLDAYGDDIRTEMQQLGMSVDGLQTDAEHATGTVRVELAADGSHQFHILGNQAYDYIDAEKLAALDSNFSEGAWVYHGTLALRSTASRRAWRALCARVPKRFVDMNWREGHLTHEAALAALQGAEILKLSEGELALCLSWLSLDSRAAMQPLELNESCAGLAALMQQLEVATLLVTYGGEGSAAYAKGECIAAASSTEVPNLVDTVGAGDTFSSVCMLAQNEGWDWPTTLKRAADFAAAICGIRGAAPVSLVFYKNWRQLWQLDKA
jgi:fructokinase